MNNKLRIASGLTIVILIFVSLTTSIQAHICGPSRIDLKVGKSCLWRIYADHMETLSFYQPAQSGDARVADAYPKSSFFAHHGDFLITANAPGTNFLQVQWSYQPTGGAGFCMVMIVVTADDGTPDLETLSASGVLVTRFGTPSITSADLFWQIDRYIPRSSPKLLVFAQCFGGNMALYRLFQNMPNTTILSATTANQEAHYGGYHDDAARALKPETGRTAQNVHEEGSIGKSTIIPKTPGDTTPDPIDPTKDKANFHKYAELPRVSGTVPPSQFSLEPVTLTGAVQSRHIVIFAGQPGSNTEFVLRHGTFTVPATIGTKERFSDIGDRDQIRANFPTDATTTVAAVGGKPDEAGWDKPGDLNGLHEAIKEAGAAMEAAADPSKEQFILFVTDHGEAGTELAPAPRRIPERLKGPLGAAAAGSRTTLGSNLKPYALDHPIVDAILRSPDNQPGLRLRIAAETVNPLNFAPGSLSLEIINDTGTVLTLNEFNLAPVDLDGNGVLGSDPEEALVAFFPVSQEDLITKMLPKPFSVDLINRSGRSFEARELLLMSGAISMGNSRPQPFITSVQIEPDGDIEVVVSGLKNTRHFIETSNDLKTWTQAEERMFANFTESFTIPKPEGPGPIFIRVRRI